MKCHLQDESQAITTLYASSQCFPPHASAQFVKTINIHPTFYGTEHRGEELKRHGNEATINDRVLLLMIKSM